MSAAFVSTEQAAEHADKSCLAAAVRAEEAADFACADLEIDMVDGREVAEALGHSLHIYGEFVGHRSKTELHIHRLAGMQFRRRLGIEDRLDHEDQLAAALPAVNDRRSVFRLGRNETHLPDERCRARHPR